MDEDLDFESWGHGRHADNTQHPVTGLGQGGKPFEQGHWNGKAG